MHRTLPVIIIFILLLSVTGYFPLLKLKQLEIKREARTHLHAPALKEALCTISLKPEDLHKLAWEEEGKEFEYENRMYDIISSDTLDGTITYYCLADEEETGLLDRLDALLEKETGPAASGKAMQKLVKSLYAFVYVLSDRTVLGKWSVNYQFPAIAQDLHLQGYVHDISRPPNN